jgi:alkylation response protein AidB-like acyl-CoA dehydrogenase
MATVAEQDESLRMIRDSAAAVAPPGGDLRRIRALRYQAPGFDPGIWQEMCDMGWLGLHLPEVNGGSALGMREFCALCEQLGTGLVPEPLIPAALAASALPAALLEPVLAGETLILPAWQEAPNSLDPRGATSLRGGKLNGTKVFIPLAAGADAFLVSTADGLALVAPDAPGVSLHLDQTQDGGHFGTLRLDNVPAEPIPGDLTEALEEATLATAAYLLGVMDRVFAITLDYLKTRQQFGKPIGSFQALAHRAVDLHIQVNLTRASVEAAAATWDAGGPLPQRQAAVSRAKHRANLAAMLVTRQAIQLHGGIGNTDDYDAGLFLRKAMVLTASYGNAALHRTRFAALAPETEDA